MSAIGCLCSLVFKVTFLAIVSLVLLAIYPSLDVDLVKISRKEPEKFISFKPNDLLSSAKLLHEDLIHGPESLVEIDGDLYFGVRGGAIVRSTRGRQFLEVIVANISANPDCLHAESETDQLKCGRVLGVRLDSKKNFYALDAMTGIKKVDITTGHVEPIYTIGPNQAGRDVIFVDDFVIQENAGKKGGHVFYVTDSSAKFGLDVCAMSIMLREDSGRVLRVDEATKEVSVLSDGIAFPNGIELMDDGQHLLVNEISLRQILKINTKTGRKEVFLPNLPGLPDNIRRSLRTDLETYWVAFFQGKVKEDTGDALRKTPILMKYLLQMTHNLGNLIDKIGEVSNCRYLRDLAHPLRAGFLLNALVSDKSSGLIMEIDSKGNVLRVLEDPAGKISLLSEVKDIMEGKERVLYLGSYANSFLGRLVLTNEPVAPVKSTTSTTSKPKTSTTTSAPTTTTRKPPSTKTTSKKETDKGKAKEGKPGEKEKGIKEEL